MTAANGSLAAETNRENTPLLACDVPDDTESARLRSHASKQKKASALLRTAWQRVLDNRAIIAIGLLILGGIIALSIYFTGTSNTTAFASSRLRDLQL